MPTPQQKPIPTFEVLCAAYPTLRRLAHEAEDYAEAGEDPSFCANRVWYGEGGQRRQDSLRARTVAIANRAVKRYGQQRCYDRIYDAIYNRLPDCGECGCFNREDV